MPEEEQLESLDDYTLRILCRERAYTAFRTRMTFRSVREELDLERNKSYEQGIYIWITRHTVLGRWHQYKRADFQNCVEPLLKNLSRSEMIRLLKNGKDKILPYLLEYRALPCLPAGRARCGV